MKRIIVQFGGTGDLAHNKLYSAYANLMDKGHEFHVLALGRRFANREEFLRVMVPPKASSRFVEHLHYQFHDMDAPGAADALLAGLQPLVGDDSETEVIYYMALQPALYEDAVRQIQDVDSRLACSCSLSKKIVVEKPFGFDLPSAVRYNDILLTAFSDKEIYRIDHYLGKEFMQNLLILRFHNDMMRGIWDRRTIESIQIVFDETHGVDQRLGFYEKIGVVRDTIQNHIMQIITYLAMDEPATLSPEDISTEKIKVLRSIDPVADFSMGRYESLGASTGRVVDVPTYAGLTLQVNSFAFAGVPIHIRTGKMQKEAVSMIYIKFRNTTRTIMRDQSIADTGIIITIHPELTIDFRMNLKDPHSSWESKPVRFRFNQAETFGANTPEAYEQIVRKILQGDKSLFPTMREISESWRIVAPMLSDQRPLEIYPARTIPKLVGDMAMRGGFSWYGEQLK